jgi:MarR family protein
MGALGDVQDPGSGGTGVVQHQLLVAIKGHPGTKPPSVGQIADYLLLQSHSAVGLVDRAEAAGFVRPARIPTTAGWPGSSSPRPVTAWSPGLTEVNLAGMHELAAAHWFIGRSTR